MQVEVTDGYEGEDHIGVDVLMASLKAKRKAEREASGSTKETDELIQNVREE